MNDETETLASLIELYGITATVSGGALIDRDGWQCRAYAVTLRREGNGDGDHENNPAPNGARFDGLETPYYMGAALTNEPTALDVLACLLSDAEGYDSAVAGGFESWAAEYGYDDDSRKAEALYERIAESRNELYAWLSASSVQSRGEHYARFMAAERP